MNHAPHLYFAWQQLVEKSQLMLRLATEEQWDELIASEMAYVNAVQEIAHLTEEVDPSTTMQEQLRPMLRRPVRHRSPRPGRHPQLAAAHRRRKAQAPDPRAGSPP